MKIALVQMNPTVGAVESNTDRIIDHAWTAYNAGARLILFPELSVSGYPPEDLILKDHFCADCEAQLLRLKKELPADAHVVVGSPVARNRRKYNAALVFHGSEITGEYHKMLLPNYGVFDEQRIFKAGSEPLVIHIDGLATAIHICEDSWEPEGPAVAALEGRKINLLVNLSASPYYRGKLGNRMEVLAATARRLEAPLLYCNLVGGQDELVFDGASMAIGSDGACVARAARFREEILYVDPEQTGNPVAPPLSELEEVYEALKLGLKDYVEKIGFKQVVVALSG